MDGVILINWHDEAIKAQIEYGAKEGQIELQPAKAELRHFKKHVISVAQYFDFKQLLYVVSLWFCIIFLLVFFLTPRHVDNIASKSYHEIINPWIVRS